MIIMIDHNKILKICKKHGELDKSKCIKRSRKDFYGDESNFYSCKPCNEEKKNNHRLRIEAKRQLREEDIKNSNLTYNQFMSEMNKLIKPYEEYKKLDEMPDRSCRGEEAMGMGTVSQDS